MKSRLTFTLILLLAWSPWFMAAYQQWTTGFEATPSGSDSISLGDDRIRELKENIRNRMGMEHVWGPSTRDNGHHAEGSANAWLRNPCRTSDLTADPNGSASTYDTNDIGKLCQNSTDLSLQMWNGSAYQGAFASFYNNVIGHYVNGVAPVDTYDPTKFAIRGIYIDATTDAVSCAGSAAVSTTAVGSQAFGDAGAACFSLTVNLTGRSTTNRGILIGQLAASGSGADCVLTGGMYRDAIGNQLGQLGHTFANANNPASLTIVAYVTGVTAASHEFALHASDSANDSCVFAAADPNIGSLTYIDLGPEY